MSGKALTLHQPFASLIVAGVKTIETRSRRMNYRGRLYVHAAKRQPVDVGGWSVDPDGQARGADWYATEDGDRYMALPLGAVVGHVDVWNCVPIIEHVGHAPKPDGAGWFQMVDGGLWACERIDGRAKMVDDFSGQLPYGDFTPGRWAIILLENPVRYDEPIPAKGKQGLWKWDGAR